MKTKGFSLLEVLITITIISTIAGFSVVTYRVPILKTEQNSVKLDLVNLASAIEQYYNSRQSYEGINLNNLDYKPISKKYDILIISANETNYKIAAIPKKSSPQDYCGRFFLDQDGNKSISGLGDVEDCW